MGLVSEGLVSASGDCGPSSFAPGPVLRQHPNGVDGLSPTPLIGAAPRPPIGRPGDGIRPRRPVVIRAVRNPGGGHEHRPSPGRNAKGAFCPYRGGSRDVRRVSGPYFGGGRFTISKGPWWTQTASAPRRARAGLGRSFSGPMTAARRGSPPTRRTPHERETVYVVPITSDSEHYPPDGKLRVYRSSSGGDEWQELAEGDCRSAWPTSGAK